MRIAEVPAGQEPPKDINVIIEVPLGNEPIKYEFDKASGSIFVDRFLYTSMRYPCNYGFMPHTLSGDGDPVDAAAAGGRLCASLPHRNESERRAIANGFLGCTTWLAVTQAFGLPEPLQLEAAL